MTQTTGKYTDFEGLRERAVALRREGLSLRQIGDALGVRSKETLSRLVKGEPPAERNKRPNAKDDLRDQARKLRELGRTYNEIQAELGCSKSSVSLWVRDMPKPEARCTPEEQRARMNAGLAQLRATQDSERQEVKREAAEAVGPLSDRELFLTGVALYWAEGTKSKPYRRSEALQFINSDPNVIRHFVRWLELLDVTADRLTLRVSIHESADIAAAEAHWAEVVGVDASVFKQAHDQETQPANRPEEHRRELPRLPRDLCPAKRRVVPSHGRRLVRHSVGSPADSLTKCPT